MKISTDIPVLILALSLFQPDLRACLNETPSHSLGARTPVVQEIIFSGDFSEPKKIKNFPGYPDYLRTQFTHENWLTYYTDLLAQKKATSTPSYELRAFPC